MTPDEFHVRLKAIFDGLPGDNETVHIKADELLILALKEVGFTVGAELYEREADQYFWYA